MIRGFFLLLLLLVMKGLGTLETAAGANPGFAASMAFGFLILAGWVAGEAVRRIGLPRLTGYLLAGALCGPQALGVLDVAVVEHLRALDRLALFFIALTAGGELDARLLRARFKSFIVLALSQLLLGGAIVALGLWLLRGWLPIPADLSGAQLAGVLALLALLSVAKSPATTLAVIVDARARGPLRDAVLGTTLLMEVIVVTLFTLALGWTAAQFSGVVEPGLLAKKLLALGGSLTIGALAGLGLRLWIERVGWLVELAILFLALLLVQFAGDLKLDALMLAIAAGFVVRNTGTVGHRFLEDLERVAQPIFLVFFGLVGAGLDLARLPAVAPAALAFFGLRLLAKRLSVGAGASLAGAEPVVRRLGWRGFVGQAGFTLGLAGLMAQRLPEVGPALRDWITAAVVLNLLVGPVLFARALARAGETEEGDAGTTGEAA